jgi:integrase
LIQSQQFRAVRRPKDLSSPYALVVVDGSGVPHLPLTLFYHETQRFLAEGTVKTYLATLLPYFDYLMTDTWRRERKDRWDSSPDAVRESVRDFLVEQLHCKAQPRETDQLVRLTGKSPSTVHVFLCALKQFYHLARRKKWYPYPHPLTDPTANLLQDIEAEERREAGHRPRMPQRSGVEEPRHRFLSDNYFKLVHETWQPHPIDDPQLHRVLRQGFPRAGLCLRDQLVVRIAYESGARIREILRLTIGDWRKRGGKQEAWAFSKGSHGRRVKVVRWSAETSRMLLAYVNTERMAIDRQSRRLDALDDGEPLFLSRRGNPYDYDSFKKHWYKLCAVLQLDLNIHALRHWFVTQEIRLICETAKEPGDIERGKEDLVRYMAWRSPETLQCYEHYFDEIRHAELQDRLHTRWSEDNARYAREHTDVSSARSPFGSTPSLPPGPTEPLMPTDQGWDSLLSLGGCTHG